MEQEAVVMTDSTVVEVLAQCEAKLMRLMDSVEGDQATQDMDAQVLFFSCEFASLFNIVVVVCVKMCACIFFL